MKKIKEFLKPYLYKLDKPNEVDWLFVSLMALAIIILAIGFNLLKN